MPKHAVEILCLHQRNQNSTRKRRRLHRFYDDNKAQEFMNGLNQYSKVLKLWRIGVDRNGQVYYRNEIENL